MASSSRAGSARTWAKVGMTPGVGESCVRGLVRAEVCGGRRRRRSRARGWLHHIG